MAIRKQQQLTVTNLSVKEVRARANPYVHGSEASIAHNIVPQRGKLVRSSFTPPFNNSASSSDVWKVVPFSFVRDSAPESQLLIIKSNGKIYKRCGGADEIEVFPGKTSFSILAQKPSVENIANRLFVWDGVQALIYDGWEWCNAGLAAPAAPATALVAGALTGTYNVCVTAVVLRGSVRIHESSRSATATASPAAQNIRVTQPTLDSRATHWSVYISEITGAGNRMRRAATVAITSATTDIAANPATTAPFAPERNDKPQASRVLFQWKNRLGMGDRTAPENFWFTAFEEVKAGLNGAPEESVPGRDSTSISDLVNNWRLPDKGEQLRAGAWHDNFAFLFSERNGYAVQGEGGLLDGRALRDFFPLKTFPFGAAGPWSVCSTSHGLVVFTPERKLYLWAGGNEVVDIGEDIQARLDGLTDATLYNTELAHWTGNGRDWLVFVNAGTGYAFFFDFTQPTERNRGIWFRFGLDLSGSIAPTAIGIYRPNDQAFLLLGFSDGSVKLMDAECQPAHLGFTCVLGSTYLGSTVQSSPDALILTTVTPQPERFVEGKYLQLIHRLKEANSLDSITQANAALATNPSVLYAKDLLAPDGLITTSTLSLGSRQTDGTQRAWLSPATGSSAVGVRAKRHTLELFWGTTDSISVGGRAKFYNNEVLDFALAWQPLSLNTQ